MSFIASLLGSLYFNTATRRGTFACPCGAVQLELIVPKSSYGIVEQTSVLCHCHDCVNFCKACQNSTLLLANNATQMVQFYKSDVTVVKGHDKIGRVKLREESFLIRCFCQECGTALGAETMSGPIVLLYSQFISGKEMPVYLPNVVLNFASASTNTRPYDKRTTVRQGMVAPLFLVRVLTRVLLGVLFHKNTGGLLLQDNDDTSIIPVGLESIPQKSQ